MTLPEKLCKARKEKGLTQEELADLAQVTVRTIQRIESGDNVPRSYTLKAIAAALELPFDTWMPEASPAPAPEHPSAEDMAHFLNTINLSCFAYLFIPWVHFLLPGYLLNRRRDLPANVIAFGRKIHRQQIYWTVTLHLLLLFTLAFNYLQVTFFDNTRYLVSYLYPVFILYFLNAGILLYNGLLIRMTFKSPAYSVLSGD